MDGWIIDSYMPASSDPVQVLVHRSPGMDGWNGSGPGRGNMPPPGRGRAIMMAICNQSAEHSNRWPSEYTAEFPRTVAPRPWTLSVHGQ